MRTALLLLAALLLCVPAGGAVILTPQADSYAQSNNSGPYGSSSILALKYGEVDWPHDYHRKAWIRYDLSTVAGSNFSGASLDLPFVESSLGTNATGNWTFSVYGLTDESLDGWSEASMNWTSGPANITNSGFAVDAAKTTLLGQFTVSGKGFTAPSTTWTISGSALEAFLTADTNNLATFIVCRDTKAPNSTVNYAHAIASKEHATVSPAALNMPNATAGPPPQFASEGFSYPTGDLNGRFGGVGWLTSWAATTAHESVVQPATPLQYAIPGGALVDGGDRALAITGNADPNPLATRTLLNPFDGNDVYISFLLRWAAGTVGQNDFVSVYFGNTGGPQIGVKGNENTTDPNRPDFFVRTTSANNTHFGNITDDSTFFIVGHLLKNASANYNQFELWVNPAYGDWGSPDVVSAIADSGVSFFSLVGLRSVNLDTGEEVLLDELRIGTTWDEVVPLGMIIPEPCTVLLVAGGLLALARRRRKGRAARAIGAIVPVLLAFALLSPAPARGALIAYDYFEDYAGGSALNGQSGGVGWVGPWTAHASEVTVQSGVIPTWGQSAQIATTGNNNNIMERAFPVQTATVYVGFLVRTTGGWDSSDFMQFYLNTTVGASETVGVSGGVALATNSPYFARLDGSANTTNSTTAFHSDDQTFQVVLKFSRSGTNYDRTDIYVNRADETTADATRTTGSSGVSSLSRFHLRTWQINTGQEIYFDALRIGTSYGEVLATAPIPPPPAYFAYEAFSYAIGGLSGQNGGTGWGGAWTGGSGAQVVEPATPLQYAIPGGETLDGGNRALALQGNADPLAGRALEQTWSQGSVYASMLLRWAGGNPDNDDFFVLRFGGVNGPQFGVKVDEGTLNEDFLIRMGESGRPENYAGQIAANTTYFIVARLAKGYDGTYADDYDRLEIWVNPAYGDSASPHEVLTGTTASGMTSFSLINFRTANLETGAGGDIIQLDELRLGTTWDEVVPLGAIIPEPCSLLLVGGGLLALARRRRKGGAARAIVPVLLALALLPAAPARAALIAYDTFEDYTAGSALNGQSGGTGWVGAWAAHATQVTVQSAVISNYGKSVRITTTGDNSNIMERQFPAQTDTVYLGLLLRTTGGWDSGDFLLFYLNHLTGASDTTGVSGGIRNTTNSPYFVRVDGTGFNSNSTTAFHLDGPLYPAVLKVSKTGGSTYYNTSEIFIGGATEAIAEATLTAAPTSGTSTSLSYFHFRTYSIESGQNIYLDEVRIATTFAEAQRGVGITTAFSGPYMNLTSLTVDTPSGRQTFSTADLVNVQLAHFKSTNRNAVFVPVGVGAPPAGSRAALIEDWALNTGIINPGYGTGLTSDPIMNNPEVGGTNTQGMGVYFTRPITNMPGPDVVVFEIDTGEPDPFVVSPISFQTGLSSYIVPVSDYVLVDVSIGLHDVYGASADITSLSLLESLGFSLASGNLQQNLWAALIDLSDLGYNPNEQVSGLFLQSYDSANLFDPVLIVGLWGEAIPEPGTLVLLGAGLAALARRRRARARRAV